MPRRAQNLCFTEDFAWIDVERDALHRNEVATPVREVNGQIADFEQAHGASITGVSG